MVNKTQNFGLNKFGAEGKLSDEGYKFTSRDRDLLDSLLKTLFDHDHRLVAQTDALAAPSLYPNLTIAATGGSIPAGTDVYYKISLLDANGNETAASPAAFTRTDGLVAPPPSEILTNATTGGTLTPGTYKYALSYYQDSGGETRAPNLSTIIIPAGTSTNEVTIPLTTPPDDADGWKIYRKGPGDLEYWYLTSVAAPATSYDDDGTVALDCTKKRPLNNTTNSTNKITVAFDATDLPLDSRATSWRIYRTFSGAFTGTSLLATVVETTTEGGGDLVTSYVDIGGTTYTGIPLGQTSIPPTVPQLDASDVFDTTADRLPATLAPQGVHYFNTHIPGTLSAITYNKSYLWHDIPAERLEVFFRTAPTGVVEAVAAEGTLTVDTQVTDTNTMTIDSKVYTFQTTLTDSDGNIEIGATLGDTQTNIINAINLSGTPGVGYAASMTLHPTVSAATSWATNDLVLTAKTAGTAGNSIATTETFTAGTNIFDAATLGTTTAGVDRISVNVSISDDATQNEIQEVYTTSEVQNEIQRISNDATSGTFTMSFDGQGPTADTDFDALPSVIKTRLESLSNITTVNVSGNGTPSTPWVIEFVDPGEQNVAQITTTDTNLVGGTSTITTSIPGSDGGTFTLSDGTDTTSAIAFDAAAATVETRLETDITSITAVTVTGAGTEASPWSIEFVTPGSQKIDLLVVDGSSLNGFVYVSRVTEGYGNTQVDVFCDTTDQYQYWQSPTTDYGEQQAETAPATGGVQVSDTLATNDVAMELDAENESNEWNLGTLQKGDYKARFYVSDVDQTATFDMEVINEPSTVMATLSDTTHRKVYTPYYEVDFTADGTEDITLRVTKTDGGVDAIRVDKYEYVLSYPTFKAGSNIAVEVSLTGSPSTNGVDANVNLIY